MPTLESNQTPAISDRGNAESNPSNERLLGLEAALIQFIRLNRDAVQIFRAAAKSSGVNEPDKIAQRAEVMAQDTIAYMTDRRNESWELLVQCDPESVVLAGASLGTFGLRPDAITGEAFITPRKMFEKGENNRKIFRGYTAVAIPGVRGIERQLLNSGAVLGIRSRAVYSQDHFVCTLGTREEIIHQPNLSPDPKQLNPIVASYAVVMLKNGVQHIHVRRIQSVVDLGNSRMPLEVQARYLAQRPCMREVIRSHLETSPMLMAMVELEDSSYRVGEEADDTLRLTKPATSGPTIKTDRPLISAGSLGESTASETTTLRTEIDAVANSVSYPETESLERANSLPGTKQASNIPKTETPPALSSPKAINPADSILSDRKTNLPPPTRSRRL